jgi:hypothetical protein
MTFLASHLLLPHFSLRLLHPHPRRPSPILRDAPSDRCRPLRHGFDRPSSFTRPHLRGRSPKGRPDWPSNCRVRKNLCCPHRRRRRPLANSVIARDLANRRILTTKFTDTRIHCSSSTVATRHFARCLRHHSRRPSPSEFSAGRGHRGASISCEARCRPSIVRPIHIPIPPRQPAERLDGTRLAAVVYRPGSDQRRSA